MKYSTVTTAKGLKALAESVAADSGKFLHTLARHKAEVAKRKDTIAKNLEATEPARRKTAEAFYNADHAAWLKDYRAKTAPERAESVSALQSALAAIKFAKEQLTDPRRVATAFMLGSEERFRLEASLDRMGNGSIGALSEKAKAERHTPEGKLLASVVLLANDRMPKASRTVDSNELAEVVFGEECKQVREYVKSVERVATAAHLLEGEFNGRAITPVERISIGWLHEGNPLNGEAPEPRKEPYAGIVDGLALMNQHRKDFIANAEALEAEMAANRAL